MWIFVPLTFGAMLLLLAEEGRKWIAARLSGHKTPISNKRVEHER